MTTPEPDNPFVSPTETRETKITPEGVMRYARVGWIMPIVGGLWIGQWVLISEFDLNLPFLLALMLICGLNLFIGLRCTIMAFALRSLNPHVGPQIGWAVFGNLLLAVLFVVGVIGLFNVEWSLPPIFFD